MRLYVFIASMAEAVINAVLFSSIHSFLDVAGCTGQRNVFKITIKWINDYILYLPLSPFFFLRMNMKNEFLHNRILHLRCDEHDHKHNTVYVQKKATFQLLHSVCIWNISMDVKVQSTNISKLVNCIVCLCVFNIVGE